VELSDHALEAEPGVVGRRFPSVTGTALSGELVHVPEDFAGAPVLLLCAYRRGTQADVDRWAVFAERRLPGLTVRELPIISSRLWRPLQGWIDGGMRGGVPPSLWGRVVTLYEEGAAARAFIGDGGGQRTQVVLLDEAGVVAFHDAGGFADEAAEALAAAAAALGRREG
jgi:hypothetical protein